MIKRIPKTEQLADRFLRALDEGDLETLAFLWAETCEDDHLARLLTDMVEETAREIAPADGWKRDAAALRRLVAEHFPQLMDHEPASLTAGDVASKLRTSAALRECGDSDVQANSLLSASSIRVPERLGAADVELWQQQLGVNASPRYWKVFRKAAILMQMGRRQQQDRFASRRQQREDRA